MHCLRRGPFCAAHAACTRTSPPHDLSQRSLCYHLRKGYVTSVPGTSAPVPVLLGACAQFCQAWHGRIREAILELPALQNRLQSDTSLLFGTRCIVVFQEARSPYRCH